MENQVGKYAGMGKNEKVRLTLEAFHALARGVGGVARVAALRRHELRLRMYSVLVDLNGQYKNVLKHWLWEEVKGWV